VWYEALMTRGIVSLESSVGGWLEVGWSSVLICLINYPSKDSQTGRISDNSRYYPIGWISY
jgi:hypothetical protein